MRSRQRSGIGLRTAEAIVEALAQQRPRGPVSVNTATGEITIFGEVKPVGVIHEKIVAAHLAGFLTVLMPRRTLRHEARHPRHAAHRAAGRTPAGVGEHEIRIGPPAHQPQQGLDVRRLDPRVFAHQLFELGKLHLYGG